MLEPAYGPNHAVLGEVLHSLGRLHSAEVSLERGGTTRLRERPRGVDGAGQQPAHARTARRGARDDHAGAHALRRQPGGAQQRRRRADADRPVRRVGGATSTRRSRATPTTTGTTAISATHCFAAGRLPEAFEPWERAIHGGLRRHDPRRRVPQWAPADTGARVMVYREQGVGDEIMMASLYPDLIDAARDVVIECDDRLVPLFARSFPAAEVRAPDARRTSTRDGPRRRPRHPGGQPPALAPSHDRRVPGPAGVPRPGPGASRGLA